MFTYHSLIDTVRQCHYDHTHNANPHEGDAVFGPPAAAWGGQTIGYPWESSALENLTKHGGFKWAVRTGMNCTQTTDYNGAKPINCITDARIEYHVVSHAMDALARYHSYYAEYRVCQYPAFTQCGIIRVGGLADMGILISPYITTRIVRPAATIDFGMGSTYGGGNQEMIFTYPADAPELDQVALAHNALYVSVTPFTAQNDYLVHTYTPDANGSGAVDKWSLDAVGFGNVLGHNPYLRFFVHVMDSWNLLPGASLTTPAWICRDGSCPFNGSLHGVTEFSVNIDPKFDPDHDGFADYNGFTNRYGVEVPDCAPLGLDCVPFSLTHVPVGVSDQRFEGGCECGQDKIFEYDTSPAGQHFILFPN